MPRINPYRTNADYRWTRDKTLAFLKALSLGASVAAAGRQVRMSRQSAYRLRARLGPDFATVWDEAQRLGRVRRMAAGGRVGEGRAGRPASGPAHSGVAHTMTVGARKVTPGGPVGAAR